MALRIYKIFLCVQSYGAFKCIPISHSLMKIYHIQNYYYYLNLNYLMTNNITFYLQHLMGSN